MSAAAGPVRACIGLGANLGRPEHRLGQAAQALAALPATRLLAMSRLYRTAAWGRRDQPDFINAAAVLETGLAAAELLEALLGIEREAGRERSGDLRWGPRVLDLDLLLYGGQVIEQPGLRVPHPHLHERAFALVPLLDVWPDARIPGYGDARDAVSALEMSNIHPL